MLAYLDTRMYVSKLHVCMSSKVIPVKIKLDWNTEVEHNYASTGVLVTL